MYSVVDTRLHMKTDLNIESGSVFRRGFRIRCRKSSAEEERSPAKGDR